MYVTKTGKAIPTFIKAEERVLLDKKLTHNAWLAYLYVEHKAGRSRSAKIDLAELHKFLGCADTRTAETALREIQKITYVEKMEKVKNEYTTTVTLTLSPQHFIKVWWEVISCNLLETWEKRILYYLYAKAKDALRHKREATLNHRRIIADCKVPGRSLGQQVKALHEATGKLELMEIIKVSPAKVGQSRRYEFNFDNLEGLAIVLANEQADAENAPQVGTKRTTLEHKPHHGSDQTAPHPSGNRFPDSLDSKIPESNKAGSALRAGKGEKTGTTLRLSDTIKHAETASIWADSEHRRLVDSSLSGNRNQIIDSTLNPSTVAANAARLFKSINEELHRYPTAAELHDASNHESLPRKFSWGQMLSSKVSRGYSSANFDRLHTVLVDSMRRHDACLNASVMNSADWHDIAIRQGVKIPPAANEERLAKSEYMDMLRKLDD